MIFVGLLVSVFFLFLTFRKIQFQALMNEFFKIRWEILVLSLFSTFSGFIFMTFRTKVLTKTLGLTDFTTLFKSVFVAFVGNIVFPFRIGEIMRVDYLSRYCGKKIPHTASLAVIVVERLFDLIVLMLLALTILPLTIIGIPKNISLYVGGVLVFFMLIVMMLIARYPKKTIILMKPFVGLFGKRLSGFILDKIELFTLGLSSLSSFWSVFLVFLFSFAYWLSPIVSAQIWLWAFSIQLSWYAPIVIILFSALGVLLPSTSAFVGTYHYFVATALVLLGVSKLQSASFAIVGHAMSLLPFAFFGIVLLFGDFVNGKLKANKKIVTKE